MWRNLESAIKLLADDCVIYRKLIYDTDIEMLQIWTVRGSGRWRML